MVKKGTTALKQAVLDLFNEVVKPNNCPPETWRRTQLVVILKKGDPSLPGNYRPIALISILYKLFAKVLCSRLQGTILSKQSCDQATHRLGFSTEDHLLSLVLLNESCREWGAELFLAYVDFEKACDAVEHDSLWDVLLDQGVSPS